jgi:hypothetical protein
MERPRRDDAHHTYGVVITWDAPAQRLPEPEI